MSDEIPKFEHDCDACVFLGSGNVQDHTYDFYACPREWSVTSSGPPGSHMCCIARFGSKGPEYASMTHSVEAWAEALAAFDARGPRPSMYHPWMPALLECWRRYRVHNPVKEKG